METKSLLSKKDIEVINKATSRTRVYDSIVAPLSNTPPSAGTEASFSPTSINDIIIEDFSYGVDVLNKYHTFLTDIRGNKPLPILRQPVLAMGCTDGCNNGSDDVRIRKTQKMFSPKEVGFTAIQCYSDLLNSNLSFMYSPDFNRGDLTRNAAFMEFWSKITNEFVVAEILRKAWFDNTAYAGGSPLLTPQAASGGAWINPTDNYFSCIDGFFTQLEANGAQVTITENAGLTYATQVLPAGASRTYMNQVLAAAPVTVKSDRNAVFLVTRSVYDNLWQSATDVNNFNLGAVATSDITIYNNEMYFGGKLVVIMDTWDYTINTFFNDGVRLYNPHRIVLTNPKNLLISTDVSRIVGAYGEIFYNQTTDNIVQRFKTTLDAKLGLDEYVIAAF